MESDNVLHQSSSDGFPNGRCATKPQRDILKPQRDLQKPQRDLQKPQRDLQKPQSHLQNPQPNLPKHQPDLPKHQPDLPKHQPDLPKHQPDLPKPLPDLPNPLRDLPKPQHDLPNPQSDLPKPQHSPQPQLFHEQKVPHEYSQPQPQAPPTSVSEQYAPYPAPNVYQPSDMLAVDRMFQSYLLANLTDQDSLHVEPTRDGYPPTPYVHDQHIPTQWPNTGPYMGEAGCLHATSEVLSNKKWTTGPRTAPLWLHHVPLHVPPQVPSRIPHNLPSIWDQVPYQQQQPTDRVPIPMPIAQPVLLHTYPYGITAHASFTQPHFNLLPFHPPPRPPPCPPARLPRQTLASLLRRIESPFSPTPPTTRSSTHTSPASIRDDDELDPTESPSQKTKPAKGRPTQPSVYPDFGELPVEVWSAILTFLSRLEIARAHAICCNLNHAARLALSMQLGADYGELSADVWSITLSFLRATEIARACRICSNLKHAARLACKISHTVTFTTFSSPQARFFWNYSMRNLREVDSGILDPEDYRGFRALITKFAKLRALRVDLRRFGPENDRRLRCFCRYDWLLTSATLRHFPHLDELCLTLPDSGVIVLNLSAITIHLKKIRTFRLCVGSTNWRRSNILRRSDFRVILRDMPCLEVLGIDNDFSLYKKWLDDHQTQLPQLRKLEVSQKTVRDISTITYMFPWLQELYLLRMIFISGDILDELDVCLRLKVLGLHFWEREPNIVGSPPRCVVDRLRRSSAFVFLKRVVLSVSARDNDWETRMEVLRSSRPGVQFTFSGDLKDFRASS